MRVALALRRLIPGRCALNPITLQTSGRVRAPIVVLGAVLCAVGLTGCAPEYAKSEHAASGRAKPGSPPADKSRAQIPLPAQALLAPLSEPSCESMAARLDGESHPTRKRDGAGARLASIGARQMPDGSVLADVPSPQIGTVGVAEPQLAENEDANLILLAKLSRELQCYREAERVVRKQLRELQASVGQTIKAVNDESARAR